MPYYLAPYIGSGTADDPCRPRGFEQGQWAAIDLRPNGGATLDGGGLNACLLYLAVHDPSRLLFQIGDDRQEFILPAIKKKLASRLYLTDLSCSTVEEFIEELCVSPPPNGWKPVTAGLRTRALEVHLGPIHCFLRLIAGGATISENWNCVDSASLNCQLTWTEKSGSNWGITTNSARLQVKDSTTAQEARADSDLASDDHYASGTLIRPVGSQFTCGVVCRMDPTATRTHYMFRADVGVADAGENYYMAKLVSGTETELGTRDTTDPVNGDLIRLETDGSSITGKVGGVTRIGPVTDTAIINNVRAGIHGYLPAAGTVDTVGLDNWEAADLAAVNPTYQPWYHRAPVLAQ